MGRCAQAASEVMPPPYRDAILVRLVRSDAPDRRLCWAPPIGRRVVVVAAGGGAEMRVRLKR